MSIPSFFAKNLTAGTDKALLLSPVDFSLPGGAVALLFIDFGALVCSGS